MDPRPPDSGWLEVRLFYVRVSPCGEAPPQLALALHPAGRGEVALPLCLDRLDPASGEATYVSTAAARLPPPAAAFEVADHRGAALLRGSLRRLDASSGWAMDLSAATEAAAAASAFEVYVAGFCAGEAALLTRAVRLGAPEDGSGGLVRRRPVSLTAAGDEDDNDMNLGSRYSDDDDGQLSWFNAGVRVGVGIGLGVCVGVGIGVGLLMRSYQATTRSLKRRFL